MANYYVNSSADAGGNGTTTATTGANCAFKTIAQVNAKAFAADDFCLFNKGQTWNEELHIPSAGTLGHPITFSSYGSGADPIIDGTGLSYCVHESVGRGYITLDGLEFADATSLGIYHAYFPSSTEGATPNWIVKNCTFTHCGCHLYGPNTIVQDNTFHGPQPTGALAGAIIISGSVATDCQVLRNTVEGYYGRGIWFFRAAHAPTANDNTVYDIAYSYGTSNEGYGINFDGYGYILTGTITATGNTVYNCAMNGIELENCSDGSLIRDNTIHDCALAGILCYNYAAYSGRYAEQRGNNVGAMLAYNVVYHCRYAVWLYQVSGVDIWNNVLYDAIGSGPDGVHISDAGTYFVTDIDCRNNIIGSGMTRSVSTQFAWENHFTAFDYNLVSNPVFTERNTSTNLTLATLQGGGTQMNCFLATPGFVNAAGHDFQLAADSPCIDHGIDVGLTEDILGNPIR